MKKMLISVVSAACFGLIATAAYASATVFHNDWNDSACRDRGSIRICISTQGVWHRVITPSGNSIYKYKGTRKYEYSYIDTGEVFRSQTNDDRRTHLFKSGEGTHLLRVSDYDEYCRDGYESTYSRVYQFVNGEVVINERSWEFSTC